MRLLQPIDLEYFVEICRQGSIAQAALVLGVTQPTLSKSLKRLEQLAGARLCDRTARGVIPTEMGRYLMGQADHLLAELQATQHSLQEMSGVRTGTASLGLAPMLSHHFAPALIHRALALRPGLHFRIAEGLFQPLLQQLQQGELDFILSSPSSAELMNPDLHSEPLGMNRFVACVSSKHALAGCALPDPASLGQYDWVLVSPRGILRNVLTHLFKTHDLSPPVPRVETNSPVLLKTLLFTHQYISFLPEDMVASETAAGTLVRLDIPWLVWQRELYLITRKHRTLSPAAQFMKTLAAALARADFDETQ